MMQTIMFHIYVLVALCVLSAGVASQNAAPGPTPRIINGTVARVENSKHLVSIRLKKYDSNFGNGHLCGGSLIGANKVLTAAHCLYNVDKHRYRSASEFVVVMGTLNRFERVKDTIVSAVSSIAYMQTFNSKTMRDDIGLMFLKTGLPPNRTHPTIEAIALANETTPAGVTCQVSGWGKTETSQLSNVLLTANVSTIRRTTCQAIYREGLLSGMLCAGRLQGGTDSCQGDSGGPLVYDGKLIGVVSWGYGCAQVGTPGVYADVQYYYDWIMARNGAVRMCPSQRWLWLAALVAFCVCLHAHN